MNKFKSTVILFQKNVTNVGTMRVASGLDSTGHLAEVKEWKEPKENAFDDSIGIWEDGSQCDKARYNCVSQYQLYFDIMFLFIKIAILL